MAWRLDKLKCPKNLLVYWVKPIVQKTKNILLRELSVNKKDVCKISEKKQDILKNQESNKIFIYLWSIIHRTRFATGNLPDIVNSFWATFTNVDWPKTKFNEEEVLQQIIDYIYKNNDKEFIICSLSFGEIIARKLFKKLDENKKKQIKLYISISWVSTMDEINISKKVSFLAKDTTTNNITISVLKKIYWCLWKIDRWALWDKYRYFMSKGSVGFKWKVDYKKIRRHLRCASIWINPWYVDRARLILKQMNVEKVPNAGIKTKILFSQDDTIYKDPESNAKKLKTIYSDSELINLWKAWHWALVEQPEKYDKVIKWLISDVWKENQ